MRKIQLRAQTLYLSEKRLDPKQKKQENYEF